MPPDFIEAFEVLPRRRQLAFKRTCQRFLDSLDAFIGQLDGPTPVAVDRDFLRNLRRVDDAVDAALGKSPRRRRGGTG